MTSKLIHSQYDLNPNLCIHDICTIASRIHQIPRVAHQTVRQRSPKPVQYQLQLIDAYMASILPPHNACILVRSTLQ